MLAAVGDWHDKMKPDKGSISRARLEGEGQKVGLSDAFQGLHIVMLANWEGQHS